MGCVEVESGVWREVGGWKRVGGVKQEEEEDGRGGDKDGEDEEDEEDGEDEEKKEKMMKKKKKKMSVMETTRIQMLQQKNKDEDTKDTMNAQTKSSKAKTIDENQNALKKTLKSDTKTDSKSPWKKYPLHDLLQKHLQETYPKPTPIQKSVLDAIYCTREGQQSNDSKLPNTMNRKQRFLAKEKDIIAQAQTGSGKTLAFLVPIIDTILQNIEKESRKALATEEKAQPHTLILLPTRELAMQVHEVISSLTSFLTHKISAPIVGGMNSIKQDRLLAHNPYIIVGTPGRIDEHGVDLTKLQLIVLDEADRMCAHGKYAELTTLIQNAIKDRAKENRLRWLIFSATYADGMGKQAPEVEFMH